MRVTVLASGSGGNATLVRAGGASVLIDAGVGPEEIERRMQLALGEVVALDAIVLTHPHGDHVGKVGPCARHFDVPVYLTEATRRRLALAGLRTRVFGAAAAFTIGPLEVRPMPIPHDAPQIALVFAHAGRAFGLVTDLGHVPRGLAKHLAACQLVLLESNHDPALLEAGPYPDFLKRRIGSSLGHLSNAQAAELLRALGPEVREVVLMHLSERCNTAALALETARAALAGRSVKLSVATQDEPLSLEIALEATLPRRSRLGARAAQLSLAFG